MNPILLNSLYLNLKHRKWSFLHKNSSLLTDALVRSLLLRCTNSPKLALDFFQHLLTNTIPISLDTHSTLIHILVSSRSFSDALSSLSHLVKHVPVADIVASLCRVNPNNRNPVAFDSLVRALTQLGLTEDARMVVRSAPVSVHAWNNLLNRLLVVDRDVGGFWALHREMKTFFGYLENVNTFNLVIYGLCRDGRVPEAVAVLYRMVKLGVPPNVVSFNMVVDGCCRNGEADLGMKLVGKIGIVSGGTVEPNCVTYNCLVNGFCKVGKAAAGEAIVREEMVRRGIEPNVRTYATLMHGYGREGKLEEALRLLDEMVHDRGLTPNSVVYNSIMNWFLKKGYIEEAQLLLSDMREGRIVPDHFTYSIIADGCWRNGYAQEVFGFYDQIGGGDEEHHLACDVVWFNTTINYLCKQGRIEEAKQVLCRMFTCGLDPDVVTYSTLIDGLFKENRVEDALRCYDEMVKEGKRPNLVTYNSVVNGLCKGVSVDVARFVVEEMRRARITIDAMTCNTLVHGYCSSRRADDAFAVCSEMRKIGVMEDVVTYNVLINFLCKLRCFGEAKELMEVMFNKGLSPDQVTYTILITAFSRYCSGEEVVELHDYMVLRGVTPDESTYRTRVSLLLQSE